MTPAQFIALWQNNPLSERAGAQGHFDDLCQLLDVGKPRDPDYYCFERGAGKASGPEGNRGWADVWKRGRVAGADFRMRDALTVIPRAGSAARRGIDLRRDVATGVDVQVFETDHAQARRQVLVVGDHAAVEHLLD